MGSELGLVPVTAHGGQESTHLAERGAADLLDGLESVAVLGERLREPVPHGAGLEHHHADGVGDDIVKLPRDPRPLLGYREPGRALALPLGLDGAFLRRFRLLGPQVDGEPAEPADPEQKRDEDELGDRVSPACC